MDEIKKWLQDDSDYHLGLTLLLKHSRNRHVCNWLSRKTDPAKLRYELSKIAGVTSVVAAFAAVNDQPNSEPPCVVREVFSIDKLPEALKPYAEAAMEAYHKARKAHTHLKEAKSDNARKKIRAEIMKLIAVNQSNWEIVNDFQQNGIIPEVKEAPTANQLLSAASTLSRSLTSLEKVTDQSKRDELLAKVTSCVSTLKSAGRTFKPATVTRLQELNLLGADGA